MAQATILDGRHTYRPQALGRVFGWFFLGTFVFSIPAYFIGYAKMIDNPSTITGSGPDVSFGIAAAGASEILLIVCNVATAVLAYPVLKRESEMGAIGYVAARLCEAMFIAIGIVSALAFLLMRQEGTAVSTPVLGNVFDALYLRAFGIGPGFWAGLANGVILAYLLYRSELVPRGMCWIGFVGGPLVMITGILVIFYPDTKDALQGVAGLVEGAWELSLSIYCIVKGFRASSPIFATDALTTLPESDIALRQGQR